MIEKSVVTATCGHNITWNLILALPSASLATHKARALLPATYTRADAVTNVQNVALLVAAFALNRGDLLRTAMADRIHQPYRQQACPLLPLLLPLTQQAGVLGVALSGAGPSVLLIADPTAPLPLIFDRIRQAANDPAIEIIQTSITTGAVDARTIK